jgi:hypothetical protein
MTRISRDEAREFYADANSDSRRDDFDLLKRDPGKVLSAAEYLEFLTWAAKMSNELPENRPKIEAGQFLL